MFKFALRTIVKTAPPFVSRRKGKGADELHGIAVSMSAAALRRVGGHVAIDFVNTIDRCLGIPETIQSYACLIEWAATAGLLSNREASGLMQVARESPKEASRALRKAIRLREALRRIMEAKVSSKTAAADDVDVLNAFLRKGLHVELEPARGGLVRRVWREPLELRYPIQLLGCSAAEFLTSPTFQHVSECEAGCGWFFVDTSATRRRRWCSMASCGNRAKARRHYHRGSAERQAA